jgi:hypothetical protein
MFREKLSEVPLVSEDYHVMPPPLPPINALHLMLLLYIINSLEVEGVGVSPSEHPAYLAPALCMFCLLLSFPASPIAPVKFIGQAHLACESQRFVNFVKSFICR